MSENDWRDICREYLENEQEDRIQKQNPGIYEQAYTVICLLINRRLVCCWSDMEKVLNNYNKKIVKEFTQKFKKTPVKGQLNKPFL